MQMIEDYILRAIFFLESRCEIIEEKIRWWTSSTEINKQILEEKQIRKFFKYYNFQHTFRVQSQPK